jgi:large subunit ribosomal protein L18
MATKKRLNVRRVRRLHRVRNSVRGSAERPRLTVFRSNRHVYAQVIDDDAGRTLCASSSRELGMAYGGDVKAARAVGEAVGQKARALQIERVGFDRGAYRYHGRVKALADGARHAGLKF